MAEFKDDIEPEENVPLLSRQSSYYIPETEIAMDTYYRSIHSTSLQELLNEYFLKHRYRLFGLYKMTTRHQDDISEKLWYTTTCYLSGKINIMLFAMLCVFYKNTPNEYYRGSRTDFINRWTMVEYSLWELLTTNSINFRSEPSSLKYFGQSSSHSLSEFLPEDIKGLMTTITSVSKASERYATTLYSPDDVHTPYDKIVRMLRMSYEELPCKCINMTMTLAGIKSLTGGIIHWFCFELYNGELYISSSWADGDEYIQSTIQKRRVDEVAFNTIVASLYTGTNIEDTITTLQEYFFLNPIDNTGKPVDPTQYLMGTFGRPGMTGPFEIVVYETYLNNVIELAQYLYSESKTNEEFQKSITSMTKGYRSGIYLPAGMEKFKILVDELIRKINSSCNSRVVNVKKRGRSPSPQVKRGGRITKKKVRRCKKVHTSRRRRKSISNRKVKY